MSTRLRLPTLVVVVALAALLVPEVAAAHIARYEYKFPLPLWVFLSAGAAAVALSAPAAAVAVQQGDDRTSRNLYRFIAPLRLGILGTVLGTLLLLDGLVGGLFGSWLFTANPLTLLIWVDVWVGLGIVCSLVGNVWDFVSPLSAGGRAFDRMLARRGVAARPYPEWLGVWPAVLLLLVWSWVELIWTHGAHPRDFALLVIGYLVLQLIAIGTFGAELWLARGEFLTVLARTFARFAPLELFVLRPEADCRAGRCAPETERIGCPSCWLEAPRERRGLRLRMYGPGVHREPALGPGGSAFVVALLATVVYDGFRATNLYLDFQDSIDWGASSVDSIGTVTMAIVLSGFALAYIGVCALLSLRENGGVRASARIYAPTLIPIASVYFIAHYFVYWVALGQVSLRTFLDPLGRGWVPGYPSPVVPPASVVWAIQVALIVWGHVVAVIEAHRVSVGIHRRPSRALVAQLPLVLLMVGYTFVGLWVLGRALAGG